MTAPFAFPGGFLLTSLAHSAGRRGVGIASVWCLVTLLGCLPAGGQPARPFPQHTVYAPGTVLPDHRTQSQLDGDVRAAYDRWKADYLVQAGTEPDGHPRYRVVCDVLEAGDTVSEGQGYGMVIVALMAGHDADARTVFDGLWEFFDDHRSEIDPRLMDWHVPADEAAEPGGDDSAFDGDADIALALLLADRQWGRDGRIDYLAEARDVLAGVWESEIGPESHLPLLGDWVDPAGGDYNEWTNRSSDLLVAHFRTFARATGNAGWYDVAEAALTAIESLQDGCAPATGLLPDFFVASAGDPTPQPAPAYFLEGPHDGHYYYNAGRAPWRLATDALLGGDCRSAAAALKMTQWVASAAGGDPQAIAAGYTLDGSAIGDYFTSFFAAPLGVAAMSDPDLHVWLDAIYDAVRDSEEGYYEDTVALLCLIAMSGNYWDPWPEPDGSGDLNGDGRIDAGDLCQLARCLAGPDTSDPGGCARCHLDGDSDTDAADLALLQALANH